MIITKIRLKNWKNFRDVEVDMRDRVFIVGPNASGKSNFLDAFRFLRDIAKPGGGLQKAVIDRGGLSKIRCLAARKDPIVSIEIEMLDAGSSNDRWGYSIGIKQHSRKRPFVSDERVSYNGELILQRPNSEDEDDEERLTQTFLEQVNANREFREIAKFLESILYLHLLPQLLKHPNSFTGPDLPGDPFGKGFLDRVSNVGEKTRKSWLKKIESALRVAVPQLRELNYTEENGKPHLEAIYEHWRPNAGKQREDQFSDGTLRLIGLFWSLLEGDGLLLLEEPELSLNGAIVAQIPQLIYRLQKPKKRQVILTTHSVDILKDKGISLDEVLLLNPSHEGTDIKSTAKIPEIKALLQGNSMSLSDAVLPRINAPHISQMSLNF